jgi:putative restriction endonuclease
VATKIPSASDNLSDVPSISAYKAALLKSKPPTFSESKQLKMLKFHYHAPAHTVTSGELAIGVGYPTYSAANLQYGTYAGRLCTALGRNPAFQVAILARFSDGEQPGMEFIKWTMLPEVVAALEQLGWVRKRA